MTDCYNEIVINLRPSRFPEMVLNFVTGLLFSSPEAFFLVLAFIVFVFTSENCGISFSVDVLLIPLAASLL